MAADDAVALLQEIFDRHPARLDGASCGGLYSLFESRSGRGPEYHKRERKRVVRAPENRRNPPQLLRKPIHELSNIDGIITPAATASYYS
jgi:hypothetical protein